VGRAGDGPRRRVGKPDLRCQVCKLDLRLGVMAWRRRCGVGKRVSRPGAEVSPPRRRVSDLGLGWLGRGWEVARAASVGCRHQRPWACGAPGRRTGMRSDGGAPSSGRRTCGGQVDRPALPGTRCRPGAGASTTCLRPSASGPWSCHGGSKQPSWGWLLLFSLLCTPCRCLWQSLP